MSKLLQTKAQEYVAGFIKGYSDINKKQKRKAVYGGVLTFLAAAAVLAILRRIESLDVGGYFQPNHGRQQALNFFGIGSELPRNISALHIVW